MVLSDTTKSRITLLESTLSSLKADADSYYSAVSNSAALKKQKEGLDGRLNVLREKANLSEKEADTYDQQFLEVNGEGGGFGSRWGTRLGLSTMQDWALAAFFSSYFLLIAFLTVYALLYSTQKMFAASVILGGGILGAIIVATLLMQFA